MTPRLRKAAVLISALETREADRLLDQMGEIEAQRVRDAVVNLGDVPSEEQEAVLAEFFGRSQTASPPAMNAESGIRLEISTAAVEAARSQPIAQSEEQTSVNHRFGFITADRLPAAADCLQRHHPQLSAVVISHLDVALAADLVRLLPLETREEILERLEDLDEVDPAVLDDLERELARVVGSGPRGAKRSAFLGEIRKRLGDDRIGSVTTELPAKPTPTIHETIRPIADRELETRPVTITHFMSANTHDENPFRFDDLLKLSERTFHRVFAQADPRCIMPALAGASREIFERYAARLSPERAAEFERHLEQLRPLRLSDIAIAQEELAKVAGRLQESAKTAAKKLRESVAAA